jgi:hypothetical protein
LHFRSIIKLSCEQALIVVEEARTMQTDTVGITLPTACAVGPFSPTKPDSDQSQAAPAGTNNADIPPANSAEPESQNTTEDTKGVIRLLQQGHFKGVADVRLRIVHFEELAALQSGYIQATVVEKTDALIQSVQAVLETWPQNTEPATQPPDQPMLTIQESFSQTVRSATEQFASAKGLSTQALLTELNAAFDKLIESISQMFCSQTLLARPRFSEANGTAQQPDAAAALRWQEQESASEAVPSADTEFAAGAFIENLRAAFATAVNELLAALQQVKVLPELSEPNGNGKAYDKFLLLYNELWSTSLNVGEPTSSLQTVA